MIVYVRVTSISIQNFKALNIDISNTQELCLSVHQKQLPRSSGDDSLNTDGFALEQSPTSSEVIFLQVNFSTLLFTSAIGKSALDMETMSPKASCLPILLKMHSAYLQLMDYLGIV